MGAGMDMGADVFALVATGTIERTSRLRTRPGTRSILVDILFSRRSAAFRDSTCERQANRGWRKGVVTHHCQGIELNQDISDEQLA